jgi:hypothetical protein
MLAFADCSSLTSASFGTGFTEPTEIVFYRNVFIRIPTENVHLTLGPNVLPVPNLSDRT